MKLLIILLVGAFILVGCKASTTGPVDSDNVQVPMKQKRSCQKLCKNIGMKLGAMVIISNRSGCVCEEKAGKSARAGSASMAGGTAVVLIEEEEARQRAEQQRQMEEQQRRQREQNNSNQSFGV